MTTPESVVIYDGKIPEDCSAERTYWNLRRAMSRAELTHLKIKKGPIEINVANVTIILDFDEGTIGVLAPVQGER